VGELHETHGGFDYSGRWAGGYSTSPLGGSCRWRSSSGFVGEAWTRSNLTLKTTRLTIRKTTEATHVNGGKMNKIAKNFFLRNEFIAQKRKKGCCSCHDGITLLYVCTGSGNKHETSDTRIGTCVSLSRTSVWCLFLRIFPISRLFVRSQISSFKYNIFHLILFFSLKYFFLFSGLGIKPKNGEGEKDGLHICRYQDLEIGILTR